LLSIIGGLEQPQTGVVQVCGQDLARLSGDEMAGFRSKSVGFVFQHFGLLEALTALENVELALLLAGAGSSKSRLRQARDLLGRVGLGKRLDHRPGQLSGGEPTGNLDDESAVLVGNLLESLRAADGCTLVIVTHHHSLAQRADRGFALSEGALRPMLPVSL
jgi:putative ABC transport system ATP-binding protein